MTRYATSAAALFVLAFGCAEPGTMPLEPDPENLAVSATNFLVCPVESTRSVSQTIGLAGGTIALDGHRMTLPAGAVLGPTDFTLIVPASDHVEIEIHADGHDSFQFLLPASVDISYDRCEDPDIDPADLSVWHIDEITRLLLEPMGGIVDSDSRRVTFTSGHLSGFIIAN